MEIEERDKWADLGLILQAEATGLADLWRGRVRERERREIQASGPGSRKNG